MRNITIIIYAFLLLLNTCVKEKSNVEVIEERELDLQMIDAYQ